MTDTLEKIIGCFKKSTDRLDRTKKNCIIYGDSIWQVEDIKRSKEIDKVYERVK